MADFLSGFSAPTKSTTLPNMGGGFLDGFSVPTERSVKEYGYNVDAELARKESEKANSFGSLYIKPLTTGLLDTANKKSEDLFSIGEQAIKNTWETYQSFPNQMWEDMKTAHKTIKNAPSDIKNSKTRGDVIGSALQAGADMTNVLMPAADLANVIFAPISAAFGAVMQSTGGQKLIDKAGNIIVDQSGITDMPAFQKYALEHPNFAEKFNKILILAMAGMETGEIDPKRMMSDIHNLAKTTIEQAKPIEIKPESTPPENPKSQLTPEQKHMAYAKSQGYEPYIAPDNLPSIDMGKPAKNTLPVIQIGDSVKVSRKANGDYTYEPINDTTIPQSRPAPESAPIINNESPAQTLPADKVVTSQAKAIAQTLEKDFNINVSQEDLATYKTKEGFMADQAQKALDYSNSSPSDFLDVAMGRKNAPRGLTNESVFAAAKKIAIDAGDTQTLLDLASSKVTTQASIKGQEIKSLDALDPNTTDPIKLMQDIRSANEAKLEKQTGEKVEQIKSKYVEEGKQIIKSKAPTKANWEDFINNIKCNY